MKPCLQMVLVLLDLSSGFHVSFGYAQRPKFIKPGRDAVQQAPLPAVEVKYPVSDPKHWVKLAQRVWVACAHLFHLRICTSSAARRQLLATAI